MILQFITLLMQPYHIRLLQKPFWIIHRIVGPAHRPL